MIAFLRIFVVFRDIENLVATQAESLEMEVRSHEATKAALEASGIALESERARRVSAETVAAERHEEIERIVSQSKDLRDQMTIIMSERLRSLDALNLRLMDTHKVEATPDLAKFQALEKLKTNIVNDIRAKESAMDRALLTTLHPAFRQRVTMNEPEQPVPAGVS